MEVHQKTLATNYIALQMTVKAAKQKQRRKGEGKNLQNIF